MWLGLHEEGVKGALKPQPEENLLILVILFSLKNSRTPNTFSKMVFTVEMISSLGGR
jgi:hypothetical protein